MTVHFRIAVAILCSLVVLPLHGAEPPAGGPFTLEAAEALALSRDTATEAYRASATALSERAVADAQLPDPQLKLGIMSLPVDTFSRRQEPMTQLQVGVQQAFPPGTTLAQRGRQTAALSDVETASGAERALAVTQSVRIAYLELFYQLRAREIIGETRALFRQLADIARSYYGTGRGDQQDVLRAELELALLDDRDLGIRERQDVARANLARWLGVEAAQRDIVAELPALPPLPPIARLEAALERHPSLRGADARIAATDAAVSMAREQYKPGWMVDLTYGDRIGTDPDGGTRPDFLSAMVTMDLPLFVSKRQDRRLAASQQDKAAAVGMREDRKRELQQALAANAAEWTRLGERLDRYESDILPRAHDNAEASLLAYQSGVTDFTVLMRARLTQFESRLQALRVRVDRAQVQARLLYLAGEPE